MSGSAKRRLYRYADAVHEMNGYLMDRILHSTSVREIVEFQCQEVYGPLSSTSALCLPIGLPIVLSDELSGSAFARRHSDKAVVLRNFLSQEENWGGHHAPHGATVAIKNAVCVLDCMLNRGMTRNEAQLEHESQLQECREHLGELIAQDLSRNMLREAPFGGYQLFSSAMLDGYAYAAVKAGLQYFRGHLTLGELKADPSRSSESFLAGGRPMRTLEADDIGVVASSHQIRCAAAQIELENELREEIAGRVSCWPRDLRKVHDEFGLSSHWHCAVVASPCQPPDSFRFEFLLVRFSA